MQAVHEASPLRGHRPPPPNSSRAKSNALFGTALAAALLGLTLLDVAPTRAPQHSDAGADASADCIVAIAIFAGVTPMP